MMNYKYIVYKLVFLLTFCLFDQYLAAQIANDTVFYNLKQLLILAQQNNKDIQLLKLELQKANQQVLLKKSKYLPKVGAFADYYWYWSDVPLIIFPENEGNTLSGGISNGSYPVSIGLPNNLLAGISLSQRLFEYSYLSAGKSTEVLSKIESEKILEKKEQLFYDIAVSYYEILQIAAKRDFIDFNISQLDRMAEILKIQLKNQMTDSLQLLDLLLKNEELLLTRREFISGLQRKSNYLKMLVGLPDSIIINYITPDYSPIMEFAPDSTDFEASIQMNILNQAQSINDLSKKQVQSEYLPTLDVKFNLLWNSQSQNLGFFSSQAYDNNISTIGLRLDIPIYQGSEKKIKMQELEINKNMLELQKQKLKEGFQLQYSNSIEELEFKKSRYLNQKEIAQLKKRYLEKANDQFKQGILPIKELLEAQSELLDSQMKSAEMLFDFKLAELDYYKWSNQILTKFE
jgi:outer membrane protein